MKGNKMEFEMNKLKKYIKGNLIYSDRLLDKIFKTYDHVIVERKEVDNLVTQIQDFLIKLHKYSENLTKNME